MWVIIVKWRLELRIVMLKVLIFECVWFFCFLIRICVFVNWLIVEEMLLERLILSVEVMCLLSKWWCVLFIWIVGRVDVIGWLICWLYNKWLVKSCFEILVCVCLVVMFFLVKILVELEFVIFSLHLFGKFCVFRWQPWQGLRIIELLELSLLMR